MKANKKSNQKRLLWKLFSEYIRRRDRGRCCTCGKVGAWKEMHAGHFIKAGSSPLPLYFDEQNVHCQCPNCNLNLAGNLEHYEWFLDSRYGVEAKRRLYEMQRVIVQWKSPDYENQMTIFRGKLNDLKQEGL